MKFSLNCALKRAKKKEGWLFLYHVIKLLNIRCKLWMEVEYNHCVLFGDKEFHAFWYLVYVYLFNSVYTDSNRLIISVHLCLRERGSLGVKVLILTHEGRSSGVIILFSPSPPFLSQISDWPMRSRFSDWNLKLWFLIRMCWSSPQL